MRFPLKSKSILALRVSRPVKSLTILSIRFTEVSAGRPVIGVGSLIALESRPSTVSEVRLVRGARLLSAL
jgi:hypothetical protein